MKVRAKYWVTQLLASLLPALFLLSMTPQQVFAQDGPAFNQQELDQMLAPIALYPDGLLSQILMASTYPLEVVEAERWSVANTRIAGAQAVQAVASKSWDPSVMSLVAFPQILRMMSSKLDWTERLGDAFLGQEQQVMDTVQALRHRAYAAGNLRSNQLARIDSQGEYISIYPADPGIAYEPYYNASVVYGSWWWPQYPPVYWAPWPGYVERPGFGAGFMWGVGLSLGAEFFFGEFDWHQHRANIANVHNNYFPRNMGAATGVGSVWQHNPDHRRGAPYREAAVRARFSPAGAAPPSRSDFRGHLSAGSVQRSAQVGPADARGAANTRSQPSPAARPLAAPAPAPAAADARPGRVNGPATHPAQTRPATARGNAPAAPGRSAVAPPAQRAHALENVDQAAAARNSSARGRDSRQTPAPAARPAPPTRSTQAPAPRAPAGPRGGREKAPGEK
jgi:hypothetical protein